MKTLYKFGLIVVMVGNAHAATVTKTTITKTSVTPTSAPVGTMFKFDAELSNPLPIGYKLKIDTLGKKLYAIMAGTGTSYSLSRTFYTAGTFNYKVVIVNAKNTAQGAAKTGHYTVSSAAPLNHAPTLALIKAETSAITNTAYTVTFNAKDVDANLNTITMNWGDNSEPETLTAIDSNDLVFSHIYTSASSFGWNAFASDKGTPVLNSKSISKIVTVSNPVLVEVIAPPVVIPVPAKTTGYTKIANNGSELPDSATLGTNPTDWACTKDNKTGLIWEVKTNDSSFRDMKLANNTTWYEPDATNNGKSAVGVIELGTPNTSEYAKAVNSQNLCGANNWRLPTKDELLGIVKLGATPAIDTIYFPDTINGGRNFWSSSLYGSGINNAFYVDFENGILPIEELTGKISGRGKSTNFNVRLVNASISSNVVSVNVISKLNHHERCLKDIEDNYWAYVLSNRLMSQSIYCAKLKD